MATVRIDIQAETQQFQASMRQCSAEMKKLSSEYSLAAAQAKLSGSAQDGLRAKVTELTGKVGLQKDIVEKNEAQHAKLKQVLEQQKSTHDTLKTKVEAAKKAYEESAKATGEDSEQTKKLKAEYENLQSQLGNTERSIQKTETAITKQEGAVTSSKAKLAELEVQLRNVNAELARAPFDAYAEKANKIGGTITKVGEAIMPASMATVGLGTAAVKTAANFDTSMSQVQATMGLTKDSTSKLNGETVNTMDALSKLARTMGKDTKFSASEAADAINILAMAGMDTDDIYSALPATLNLAAAGNIGIAQAADYATGIMSGFGMKTEDASKVADVLAVTASSAKGSVSDFGAGLAQAAGQASITGQSFEDTATALGILGNHNISAAEGGNMLQRVLKNLYQPTSTAKDALDALGVSAYDSEGKARPLQDVLTDLRGKLGELSEEDYNSVMGQIFDTASLRGANFLIQDSGEAFDNLRAKIGGASGAAEKMAEVQQDNLQGQLTILKSQLEELAISFGELLMPKIREVVGKIQDFVDKLNNMDEGQKQAIIRIGLVVAAAGPLLVALGKMIIFTGQVSTQIGNMVEWYTKAGGASGILAKAQTGLSSAFSFLTSPIGIVIGVIAVLVAAFIHLWRTNEDFRNAIIAIWERIKGAFQEFVGGIQERLSALGINFQSVTQAIGAIWDGFCNLLAPRRAGDLRGDLGRHQGRLQRRADGDPGRRRRLPGILRDKLVRSLDEYQDVLRRHLERYQHVLHDDLDNDQHDRHDILHDRLDDDQHDFHDGRGNSFDDLGRNQKRHPGRDHVHRGTDQRGLPADHGSVPVHLGELQRDDHGSVGSDQDHGVDRTELREGQYHHAGHDGDQDRDRYSVERHQDRDHDRHERDQDHGVDRLECDQDSHIDRLERDQDSRHDRSERDQDSGHADLQRDKDHDHVRVERSEERDDIRMECDQVRRDVRRECGEVESPVRHEQHQVCDVFGMEQHEGRGVFRMERHQVGDRKADQCGEAGRGECDQRHAVEV